ncbi:MAG: hypothetical protein ACP5F6_09995 [Microbacter sp.]
MKTKKMFLKRVIVSMLFTYPLVFNVMAQELEKSHFSVGADVVSSYVWRGIPQEGSKGGTPNIQPAVTYANGVFSLGAWGSTAFSGEVKEIDFSATLSMSNTLSFTLTDYNWNNHRNYFNYQAHGTDHILEATFSYAGVQSFPLSLTANSMFFGDDKNENGKNAYSSYIELNYPLTSMAKIFMGASLVNSPMVYSNLHFAVINLGMRVAKMFKISDTFSMPLYGVIGCNPQMGKAFFVAGFTL